MADIPSSWRLKKKQRPDGKLDLVGTDATGSEYVARTTEQEGVTERDLQILRVGNREQSSAEEFTEFYAGERRRVKKAHETALAAEYDEAAELVVHAGLHLSYSRVGCITSGAARAKFDAWIASLGEENGN
jgi:hypothetical protein